MWDKSIVMSDDRYTPQIHGHLDCEAEIWLSPPAIKRYKQSVCYYPQFVSLSWKEEVTLNRYSCSRRKPLFTDLPWHVSQVNVVPKLGKTDYGATMYLIPNDGPMYVSSFTHYIGTRRYDVTDSYFDTTLDLSTKLSETSHVTSWDATFHLDGNYEEGLDRLDEGLEQSFSIADSDGLDHFDSLAPNKIMKSGNMNQLPSLDVSTLELLDDADDKAAVPWVVNSQPLDLAKKSNKDFTLKIQPELFKENAIISDLSVIPTIPVKEVSPYQKIDFYMGGEEMPISDHLEKLDEFLDAVLQEDYFLPSTDHTEDVVVEVRQTTMPSLLQNVPLAKVKTTLQINLKKDIVGQHMAVDANSADTETIIPKGKILTIGTVKPQVPTQSQIIGEIVYKPLETRMITRVPYKYRNTSSDNIVPMVVPDSEVLYTDDKEYIHLENIDDYLAEDSSSNDDDMQVGTMNQQDSVDDIFDAILEEELSKVQGISNGNISDFMQSANTDKFIKPYIVTDESSVEFIQAFKSVGFETEDRLVIETIEVEEEHTTEHNMEELTDIIEVEEKQSTKQNREEYTDIIDVEEEQSTKQNREEHTDIIEVEEEQSTKHNREEYTDIIDVKEEQSTKQNTEELTDIMCHINTFLAEMELENDKSKNAESVRTENIHHKLAVSVDNVKETIMEIPEQLYVYRRDMADLVIEKNKSFAENEKEQTLEGRDQIQSQEPLIPSVENQKEEKVEMTRHIHIDIDAREATMHDDIDINTREVITHDDIDIDTREATMHDDIDIDTREVIIHEDIDIDTIEATMHDEGDDKRNESQLVIEIEEEFFLDFGASAQY